jgi:hypothetical protein
MMVCAVTDIGLNQPQLHRSMFRYGVFERLARCARKQGVGVVAWGIQHHDLRVVFRGSEQSVRDVMRGVRVGTVRAAKHWSVNLPTRATDRWRVGEGEGEEEDAIYWAHEGAMERRGDPLADPWTSHRDLMGYRRSLVFSPTSPPDAATVASVHVRLGGGPVPRMLPPTLVSGSCTDLCVLLKMASSVLGVLPGDRRAFRLFVQLGRHLGWPTRSLAEALCLTRRRIRQLSAEPEHHLELACLCLSDARLRCTP